MDRDLATVLGGHALRLGLGLLSSALLARALGPAALSRFSVVGGVMMIVITLADLGLSSSAVRFLAGDDGSTGRMTATFTRLKLGSALAAAAGLWLLAAPLTSLLGLPAAEGTRLLRIGAAGVLATSASGIVAALLQALRRFTILIGTQTLNIALTVLIFGLLFVTGRLTVTAALWVGVVTALGMGLAGWIATPAPVRRAALAPVTGIGAEARRLWGFGRWLWLGTILSILVTQLELFMLNRWAAPAVTGFYALALTLSLRARVVHQTLFTVLLPDAAAAQPGRELRAFLRRSTPRALLLGGALLLLLPVARLFVVTVYGPDFGPAAAPFVLLILTLAVEVASTPLLLLAYPLDLPRAIAAGQGVRLLTLALGGALLIPAGGPVGAALAKLVATLSGILFLGGLIVLVIRRRPGVGI